MRWIKELLSWYDSSGRQLPWRSKGKPGNPYHVWLSEIMLQQTTVATVKSYFQKFIELWPRLEDLAAADLDEILHAWQGLGYYARAHNLHRCAQEVVRHHGGRFPQTAQELETLPGIGPYTAGAIAMIAFNQQAQPIDGNIERVIARLNAISTPMPKGREEVRRILAEINTPRPGDFLQALMDLGATVCTPRAPACPICPLQKDCMAYDLHQPEAYPVKPAKKPKPHHQAIVFWAEDGQGRVLVRRRAEKGLLGGLMEFPSSAWRTEYAETTALKEAPFRADWQAASAPVRHTFTHFHLTLYPYRAVVAHPPEGQWIAKTDLHQFALPTLMRKVEKVFA